MSDQESALKSTIRFGVETAAQIVCLTVMLVALNVSVSISYYRLFAFVLALVVFAQIERWQERRVIKLLSLYAKACVEVVQYCKNRGFEYGFTHETHFVHRWDNDGGEVFFNAPDIITLAAKLRDVDGKEPR